MEPDRLLRDVAKILENLKIPYLLSGGLAVVVWGRPRFTADIDLVIQLLPDHITIQTILDVAYIENWAKRHSTLSIWQSLQDLEAKKNP